MSDQISKDWLKSELDALSKRGDDRYDALSKRIDDKHDSLCQRVDDKHDTLSKVVDDKHEALSNTVNDRHETHARETEAHVNGLHKRIDDTQSAMTKELAAHINGLHKRIEDAQYTNHITLAVATIIIMLAIAFFTYLAPNSRGQNPAHNTDLNKLDSVAGELTQN